jgi:hypothetical protein
MSVLKMRKVALALGTAGVMMIGAGSIAQAEVVLTGSALAGAGYSLGSTCVSGCSASYSSSAAGGAGGAVLTSSDNVGGGSLNQFDDSAILTITNGYMGVSLGNTLSDLVSAGAAGNVSFNLYSATAVGGQYAYWNVEISNGANTAIINAFGDNNLGANPFNQGAAGSSSVDASGGYQNGTTALPFSFGSTWTTVDGTVVDGLALGSWTIDAVTISVGGWNTGGTQTDVISSVSTPGSATPIPAALPLFAGGLSLFGGAGLWRKRRRKTDNALVAA